ncbi:MAG: phytoene desaturase family protein [Paracoccaceae bacterium]
MRHERLTPTPAEGTRPDEARGPRVVVVGAGPGGLATAMMMARSGARVTVLEARDRVGGRTSAIEDQGFRFDLGPTFFLYPKILSEIFESCGERLEDHVELKRLDPMYDIVFESGGAIRASADPEALKREVARISPRDAEHVEAYLADNAKKFDRFYPILERPFFGLGSWFKRDILRALPMFRPWATVDQDLGRHFEDPRVRLAFSFQSKYLGMSPFKCPSLFTILAHVEYGHGVFHPVGGCAALLEAMARVATKMGVDIRLADGVEAMLFDGDRAAGVRARSGVYPADAVVVNADFANAMQRLVPDEKRRRWSNRKLAKKRYSCSTFMLYLGLKGTVDSLGHHTINLSEDYLGNLRDIEEHRAPEDPTIYVQNACVTDPTLAPEGCSTLYVLAPVGNQEGGTDWAALAPQYRKKVLARLEKLGVTDIENRIVTERMVTPADWESDLSIYRGATFNLAHNLGQMLHLRPQNRFEELDGVYLTGGGTHPGSGLPTIFESARITSRLMAEDLDLEAAPAAKSLAGMPA